MLGKFIMFASMGSWLRHPINALCLAIDSFIYSLVAYSYRLFMLMTQLNYNAIYEMIYPLIDRVKALIIVFVLFKVSVFLIQCLIDPDRLDDKSAKGGRQLVVNILVCAGIMGISPFVFDLMNDLSMAILGSTTGASYEVLPGSPSDGGLISRLVFGNTDNTKTLNSYGPYLAASTLNIFLHSKEGSGYFVADAVYNKIIADADSENSDFTFDGIITLADDIGRTVDYTFPILSTVVGLFIIYSLVKISIEVGIRMFKLIVLQVIAPIPIASIISDGIGGKKFTDFYKLYISTFTQIFVRVASLYLITAFIGEFFTAIMDGGTGLITVNASGFTKFLILVIVIVAGYSFVNVLPKFIGNLFGLDMGEGVKGNFGGFMKGLVGAGIGAVGGFAVSRATGLGVMSSLGNALNAGYNGTKGGKIADNIKNAAGRAAAGYAAGGMFRSTLNNLEENYGFTQARNARMQMDIERLTDGPGGTKSMEKKIEHLEKLKENAKKNVKDNTTNFGEYRGINLGSHKGISSAEDLYNKAVSSDSDLAILRFNLENAANSNEAVTAQNAIAQREEAIRAATKEAYNAALERTNDLNGMTVKSVDNSIEATKESLKQTNERIEVIRENKDRARRTWQNR